MVPSSSITVSLLLYSCKQAFSCLRFVCVLSIPAQKVSSPARCPGKVIAPHHASSHAIHHRSTSFRSIPYHPRERSAPVIPRRACPRAGGDGNPRDLTCPGVLHSQIPNHSPAPVHTASFAFVIKAPPFNRASVIPAKGVRHSQMPNYSPSNVASKNPTTRCSYSSGATCQKLTCPISGSNQSSFGSPAAS